MMRVLLDATSIPPKAGGVARYIEGIVAGLAELDEMLELHIACKRRDAGRISTVNPGAVIHVAPTVTDRPAARFIWEQIGLPRLARIARADVIHSPHYTMPLFSRRPVVVTVHDATFFSHPELHSRLKRLFFSGWSWISARRARALIAPSDATRREFIQYTRSERRPIYVAYHGVSQEHFHPPTPEELVSFTSRLDLESHEWIAFLGTLEPRKNVANLVRAFDLVVSDRRIASAFPRLRLVLAGSSGWETDVDDAISDAASASRIERIGFVDAADLPALLGGSVIVAYPSLGEGFGLPVLEAMACGAPVLTTRKLALPEIGGDAVAYSGLEADEIAAVLLDLLLDPSRRAEFAEAGRERALKFTWRNAALVHCDVYRAASRWAPE